MAGVSGGAWKVAYADFVTAMMALFMVLWLTTQKEDVKQALEDYFRDPWARRNTAYNRVRQPTLEEPRAGMQDLNKSATGSNPRLEPHAELEAPEHKRPKLVTVRSPERTTQGTLIQFEFGSAELTASSKERLRAVAEALTGIDHKIDIRGHVSREEARRLPDPEADGWQLAFQRAMNVAHELQSQGIAAARLRPSLAGAYEPLNYGTTGPDVRSNARVEVLVLAERVAGYRNPDLLSPDTLPEAEATAEHEPEASRKSSPATTYSPSTETHAARLISTTP
jgi:chemotaxis protein MotB